MKRILFFLFVVVNFAWSIPKPMESITNYNVMMVHGAYGPKNDDGELQGFDPGDYSQAIEATEHLGAASMGSYTSNNRVTRWISHNILEEPQWEKDSSYVRNSYVYNWRAFSNTRNSSNLIGALYEPRKKLGALVDAALDGCGHDGVEVFTGEVVGLAFDLVEFAAQAVERIAVILVENVSHCAFLLLLEHDNGVGAARCGRHELATLESYRGSL